MAIRALQQRQIQLARLALDVALGAQFDLLVSLRTWATMRRSSRIHSCTRSVTNGRPTGSRGPGHQYQQRIQHLADVRASSLGQWTLHLLLQFGQ